MIAHFVLAGQSNLDQWFHAGDGAALDAFRETFLALNPQYTGIEFFDAARGGSAMLGAAAADYADLRAPDDPELHQRIEQNYWYDKSTGNAGPNLTLFTERLQAEVASGTEFLGVIWAQGEADTTYVGANGAETYTEGLQYVLDQLMQASGAPQIYIQALGDRAFYSEELHGGSAAIRDAQQAIADSSDAITLATTIFDLALRDSVHLTDDGYQEAARRMAIAISSGETSPATGDAMLLDANTILVQLDLAPDQFFSGAFDLNGLTLSDNGAEIAITSASITAAGLVRIETLTALSNPTISYAAVQDSVTMQQGDVITVTGPNGAVPILPFDLTLSQPEQQVQEIAGGLRIDGGALSERVIGLSGDDMLFGHDGHDTLIGGWGSDILVGGNGSDVFVPGADLQADTVLDFNPGRDAIGLVGYSMAGVSFQLSGTGDLEVQTSMGERIVLTGIGPEQADDIRFHMLGTDAANVLTGWQGDDRIFAGGGDDTIDSGAGYDRITTGDGADVVRFGSGYGTIIAYDFDVTRDRIDLTDISASDLTLRDYKGVDLDLRTEAGDRLILRNVALSDSALVQITDAPPTVGYQTGTEGNDTLRGGMLDDLFESFGGTDRLYGGGGADVFAFRDGAGLNVVYDFEDGQDLILIDAADFTTLSVLRYNDKDAEIRLDSGDRLVLRDIDAGLIDADDFIFETPDAFV